MLGKKSKRHVLLVVAASIALVAGTLYGVTTNTYDESSHDFGGNPAYCGSTADHDFAAGAYPFIYSYSSSVYHNGIFVDSDYHSDSGTGPDAFTEISVKTGYATAVSTSHNTTGAHGSYIENDNNPNDWAQDTESSLTSRASD